MDFLRLFLEAFVPIFVAIDPFGLVPLFLAVTADMTVQQRRRVTFEAVVAATIISFAFMFLGQQIFRVLGITDNDFRIAGGVLLLVLSILDLVNPGKPSVQEAEIVGIVPLAMPLIAGPATLTTALVLAARPEFGYSVTALSLALNFLILLVMMLMATRIQRIVGANALKAFSKLVMVLLAAIAVNFIRVGITNVLRPYTPVP